MRLKMMWLGTRALRSAESLTVRPRDTGPNLDPNCRCDSSQSVARRVRFGRKRFT